MKASEVKKALQKEASPEKAKVLSSFFKTGEGAGDHFLGVTVPVQRKIALAFQKLSLEEVQKLLSSPIHEERITALWILRIQWKKADTAYKELIHRFYLEQRSRVNNWDLVDTSAHIFIGEYFYERGTSPQKLFEELITSAVLWERRIAVVATLPWNKRGDGKWITALAVHSFTDKEDLMHKAVGWMLREWGKANREALTHFLKEHAGIMPRTMLRYAIEKYPEAERKQWLTYGLHGKSSSVSREIEKESNKKSFEQRAKYL